MVKFNFTQAPDAAAIFGGLSKTIRQVGQQVNQLDKMAKEEQEAQNVLQNDLDSVFGLVGKGLSEQDYQFLVQEQNAIAQKEGIIRAHENFSLLNAVDEERAKIRLSAYTQEMKKQTPAMSNPTQPLSFEEAESNAFKALEGIPLGQDSVGNDVFMQFDTQNTSEMVALSRGMAANNLALRNAVDDNKHELAIESATNQYQRETYNLMELLASSPENAEMVIPMFKANANKYFGFGVQNINALTLSTMQSFATESVLNLPFTPGLEQDIFDVLDTFEESIELRDGAGAFAAKGTENNNKINQIREGVSRDLALREKEVAAQRTRADALVEEELKTFVLEELGMELQRQASLTGEALDWKESIFIGSDFERELSAKLIRESIRLGHTDPDKVLGSFDSIISNLTLDSNDSYLGEAIHNINFVSDDEQALVNQEQEAFEFFQRGLISIEDYKDISSKIKSKQTANMGESILDGARREGGFGSSTIRATMTSAAEDILKLNDVRIPLNTLPVTYASRFSEDNNQLSTNKLLVEQRHILDRDIALGGGSLTPLQDAIPFTPQEEEFLRSVKGVKSGRKVGVTTDTIRSVDTLFREIVIVNPGEDISKVRTNISIINQRAVAYAQYLAMRRLLIYNEQDTEDINTFEKESTTGSGGIIR